MSTCSGVEWRFAAPPTCSSAMPPRPGCRAPSTSTGRRSMCCGGGKATRGAIALDFARPEAYVFGAETLPRLTLKGLRHTHATLLLELGIHPEVVQERLGHSNISTTMNIYSHATPTMQRDAVSRLGELLS